LNGDRLEALSYVCRRDASAPRGENIEHPTSNIEFEDENEDEDEKEGKRSTSNVQLPIRVNLWNP
jgi:hypothetical protein